MNAPWTLSDVPDQTGRTAVVTGANSGLGLVSARALAGAGARVLMACRDPERAERARAEVRAVATGPAPEVVALDLADVDSVRAAAADIAARVAGIDVLMNNAGVMAIPLRRTAQGFEAQFATNHLGHFALTGLLLPLLLAVDAPRVVTTSSTAHRIGAMHWDDLQWTRRYRRWSAYGQSKLANLLFSFELDRRARAAGAPLVAAAAHPGYAATNLQAVGPTASGRRLSARVMQLGNVVVAQTAEGGALPQLYAATAADVEGGAYYGPGGFQQIRGAPTRVGANRAARSEEAARRLWTVSEDLTGVTFAWPGAESR